LLLRHFQKMEASSYYQTYSGHTTRHLETVLTQLRKKNDHVTFLAGDSSLDNKYWILDQPWRSAVKNGYHLAIPTMKPDVCYHLNCLGYPTVNCAVEASTLAQREGLLPQDQFIRRYMQPDDTLIVSIGGNDIALAPSMQTIWNLLKLVYLNTDNMIQQESAFGMPYFVSMFQHGIENYIVQLTMLARPRKVIVCGIYYPDEAITNSWADKTLGFLGYNSNPLRLQLIIQKIYQCAISKVKVPGLHIEYVPMFSVLDGKTSSDYVHRVEPSATGGQKLAVCFSKLL